MAARKSKTDFRIDFWDGNIENRTKNLEIKTLIDFLCNKKVFNCNSTHMVRKQNGAKSKVKQ